ncbi:MAG: hypothetical protein KJP21_09870 [Bacteroidia bacterium]|nr:hypothetical protein [Bacteroidia bacterium]NNJ55691.1 hypothetical protein [Bacteroidia bacterium]
MKKLLVLLSLSLFVVAISSCKKPPLPIIEEVENNGGGSGGEDEISPFVGSWNYTKINLTNGILEFMGNEIGTFEGTGSKIVGEVIISESPNVYSTEISFTADVDAMFFGQTQPQQIPVEKTTSTGTWTESGGNISLTDDNGNAIAVISSTSSKIVFTGNFANQLELGPNFLLDATSDVEFTIEK